LSKIQRSFRRKSLEPLYFSYTNMSNKSTSDANPSEGTDPGAGNNDHIYKMKVHDSPTSVKMPEHLDDKNWGIWCQHMTYCWDAVGIANVSPISNGPEQAREHYSVATIATMFVVPVLRLSKE
jgi:hypothetical protein